VTSERETAARVANDAGVARIVRYVEGGKVKLLDEAVSRFSVAYDECPIESPIFAAILANTAAARLVRHTETGRADDLEISIMAARSAADTAGGDLHALGIARIVEATGRRLRAGGSADPEASAVLAEALALGFSAPEETASVVAEFTRLGLIRTSDDFEG
jgi:hypothetical protein